MRKRAQIALAVVAVAIVSVVVWQVCRQREPVYQGKRLSVWLDDYFRIKEVRADATYESGEVAIREVGNNALPTLLKMARARDSKFKRKVAELIFRKSRGSIRLHNDWEAHRKAILGFTILGPTAASCVPSLVNSLTSDDSSVRCTAANCLGLVGPAAQNAVPALVQCLDDSDFLVCLTSAWALGQIHSQPALVVPALLHFLDTQTRFAKRSVDWRVFSALSQFGPEAGVAVPYILERLEKMNPQQRETALNALNAIDHEAAAKAGVK